MDVEIDAPELESQRSGSDNAECPPVENTRVALALLDSPQGEPLQHWYFEDKEVIRIGRSAGNDVVIADHFVSREHVALTSHGGAWVITVLSSQGIYCGMRKIQNLRLEPSAQQGFVFRLGAKGPFLRFDVKDELSEETTTLAQDPTLKPISEPEMPSSHSQGPET